MILGNPALVLRRYPPPPEYMPEDVLPPTATTNVGSCTTKGKKLISMSQFLPRPTLDGGDSKIICNKLFCNHKPALVLKIAHQDSSLHTKRTPTPSPGATAPEDKLHPDFMIPPSLHYPTPSSKLPPSLLWEPQPQYNTLLAAPLLTTGEQVTGATKNILCKENKRVQTEHQEQQTSNQSGGAHKLECLLHWLHCPNFCTT
jgi:hypothetical protein